MAVAILFDTLDYAKKLETAGVPTAQAELQATALGNALAKAVVTPRDLVGLEGRLAASIESVDSKLSAVDVKLSASIESLGSKLSASIESLDSKLSALDTKLSASIESLDSRLSAVETKLSARIDSLDARMDAQVARLSGTVEPMKWMFGFLAAMNIGILIRLFTMA